MIYGLILLEHPKFDAATQRSGILQFAQNHKWATPEFISFNENPNIMTFRPGDTVICYAWNCLCARAAFLRTFIQYMVKNNIYIHSVTSQYCFPADMDSDAFRYAFAMYADIISNFMSNKSAVGVRTRIANGKAPGRHTGSKNRRHVLDGRERAVWDMYSAGHSVYSIAKKMKVSAPTIKRFLDTQN